MHINSSLSNLENSVTLLVTPHDDYRYPYLFRFLNYYKSWGYPFRIVILNSCQSDIDSALFDQFLSEKKVTHIKFEHEVRFEVKTISGLNIVSTEYCVLCSEDDFITISGLKETLLFLENNSDYSAAIGKGLVFHNEDEASNIEWNFVYKSAFSIESEDPIARFSNYFNNYNIPVFFALYRTNLLKTLWKSTLDNTDDVFFGEILPALLTVINGKFKVLDVLYIIREFSTSSSGQSLPTFKDFIESGTFKNKYRKFESCLGAALSEKGNISFNKSKPIIKQGMRYYLGYSWKTYNLRCKIVSFLKYFGIYIFLKNIKNLKFKKNDSKLIADKIIIPYQDVDNPDYEEWRRIDQIIHDN